MSIIPQTYTCDADGCTKRYDKDANGWLAMFVSDSEVFMCAKFNQMIFDADKNIEGVAQYHDGCKHVCGYDHASQLFAKWMASGSL